MAGSTYTHGFAIEPAATYGDVRSLSIGLYKIGLPPRGASNQPFAFNIPTAFQENLINSQTYPTVTSTHDNPDAINIDTFTPVNDIPWVMMFGGYTAGTDTIANFSAGSPKPRYSLYQSTTDEGTTKERSIFGWVANKLEFNYELKTSSVTMSLSGIAAQHNRTDYTPTSYKYPDSDGDGSGTESTVPYDYVNSLTWNSQSLGNPFSISGTFMQDVKRYGTSVKLNDQSPITGSITIQSLGFIADGTNGLETDKDAGTTRTLSFQLHKSGESSHTPTLSFAGCLCSNCHQQRIDGEKVITTANFIIGSFSMVRDDGTNDAFFAMS